MRYETVLRRGKEEIISKTLQGPLGAVLREKLSADLGLKSSFGLLLIQRDPCFVSGYSRLN
jgi:hypothetical protein